ncbi:helix-turn-helix transcriptional regulator [Amycolatopsis cihanbeyliensis]
MRWLLGVELAHVRKHARMTIAQAAEASGLTRAKVSYMETGRYQQYPDDVAHVLNTYGAPRQEVDRLVSLCAQTEGKSWWAPWSHVMPDWFKTFVGLEGLAAAEFVFEPMVLPGLLQTEEYAQAITEATGFVRRDHGERFVSFRLARANRLTEEEPLQLHTVIGEAALRLQVGTPEVREAQFRHLLKLARQPNVTIQVLRPEDGPHTATMGKFSVLDFERAQSIAYNEHLDGAVYVQDQDAVRTYKMAVENLRSVASAPTRSLTLIRGMIDGT